MAINPKDTFLDPHLTAITIHFHRRWRDAEFNERHKMDSTSIRMYPPPGGRTHGGVHLGEDNWALIPIGADMMSKHEQGWTFHADDKKLGEALVARNLREDAEEKANEQG